MLARKAQKLQQLTVEAFLNNHSKAFTRINPDVHLIDDKNSLSKNLDLLQSKLNLNTEHILHIKTVKPFFLLNQSGHITLQDWHDYFLNTLKINETDQQFILSTFPQICDYAVEFYPKRLAELKEKMGWSEEQSIYVLVNVPKAFFMMIEEMEQLVKLFVNLFEKTQSEITQLLAKKPYILLAPIENAKKNNFLLFKYGLSVGQIYKVFLENPTFMFQNPGNLLLTFKKLTTLKINPSEMGTVIVRNPYILTLNFPKQLMPQLKFWKNLGFGLEEMGRLVILYPFLLTKSIKVTKEKLVFLNRDFQMDVHKSPIAVKLLNYNLESFLLPRGRLMLEHGIKDWKEVLDLSDKDFLKKFKLTEFPIVKIEKSEKIKGSFLDEGIVKKYDEIRNVSPRLRKGLYQGRHL